MPTAPEKSSIDSTIDTELGKLLDWLRKAESATSETMHREISVEDYRFYAGDQDTAAQIAELEEKKRPTSTFNEIKPKIDMLIGMAAQTKHDPVVLPVGSEDKRLAELMQNTLKFYHKKLKIADKEIDCFDHTVKSGRSLLHFHIDASNPFAPEIKATRFPGDKFFLDPDGIEYDLSDHRRIFLEKWMTKDDITTFWPGVDISEIEEFGKGGTETLSFFNEGNELYRIIECWYRKWVKVKYFVNPITKKPEYLSPRDFKKFVIAIQEGIKDPNGEIVFQDKGGLEGIDSFVEEIHYMIFSGTKKLSGGKSPYRGLNKLKMFPCILFGAYEDTDNNNWFSPIKLMKDPQKSLNTMRRQLVHLLQTLPKGLLMHEVGAIPNIEEYEERSSDPTYHLEVAAGKIDRIKFEKQPTISNVYQVLDMTFSQGMKDASGIQDSMMAMSEGTREPGITRRLKQETGITVLYTLYHNFQKSRIQVSRTLLSLMQQYVTVEQVIRIQGPEGAQLIEINSQMNPQSEGFNDISTGEFDIVVDETVESATSRLAVAQVLTDFSHNNPGMIPPDIILDYAEIPYTAQMRVKEFHAAMQKLEQDNKEREFELREKEIAARRVASNTNEKE